MRRLTKTFIENRYYVRQSPKQFVEVPKDETGEGPSLDQQVKDWVAETGNIIIHPGQLGMHTSWHGDKEDPFQMKCLTFGQTILYEEPDSEQRPVGQPDPRGIDIGANPAPVGSSDPRPWGGGSFSVDGPGSSQG